MIPCSSSSCSALGPCMRSGPWEGDIDSCPDIQADACFDSWPPSINSLIRIGWEEGHLLVNAPAVAAITQL